MSYTQLCGTNVKKTQENLLAKEMIFTFVISN